MWIPGVGTYSAVGLFVVASLAGLPVPLLFVVAVLSPAVGLWLRLRHLPQNKRASFLLGDIPYLKNFQSHHRRFHVENGPIVLRRFGHTFVVSLGHPDYFAPVLQKHSTCVKGQYWDFIRPIMGSGLPMLEGVQWQKTRKLLNPPFSDTSLGVIVPKVEPIAENLVEHFASVGPDTILDMEHEFLCFTYDVIMETTFSENPNTIKDRENPIPLALDEALRLAHTINENPLHPARLFPTAIWRELTSKSKMVHRYMEEKVLRRMQEKQEDADRRSVDLLDMMIAAADEMGEVNPVELGDQAVSFVIGGQDTSSISLSWGIYFMCTVPRCYDRLMEEIRELYVPGKPLEAEKLQEFVYMEAFIKEVSRHRPPSLAILRQTVEDIELKGHKIPKGTAISIPVNAPNFHPDLWGDDVNEFKPERFLDPERKVPLFSLLTFSGGPRRCIGERFSMIEQKVLLIRLLHRLRPRCHNTEDPFTLPAFTLRTRDGIKVSFDKVQ